jgi:hypothetical protein
MFVLIGGIRQAGATTAAFDDCFDGEPAFVCGPAESGWCGEGEAGSLDPGVWASSHDVPAWVDNVAQSSGFVVRRTPGRLIVAEAQ